MNKLINEVKDNQYKLNYQRLGTPMKIVLFPGAVFRNLGDGGQGGQVSFLTDRYGKCNFINGQSKRIKRIVCSTRALETMVDGVESAVYISVVLKKLCPEIKKH